MYKASYNKIFIAILVILFVSLNKHLLGNNDVEIYFNFSPFEQRVKVDYCYVSKERLGKKVEQISYSRRNSKLLVLEIVKLKKQIILKQKAKELEMNTKYERLLESGLSSQSVLGSGSRSLLGFWEDKIYPKESYSLLHIFYDEALQGFFEEQSMYNNYTDNFADGYTEKSKE